MQINRNTPQSNGGLSDIKIYIRPNRSFVFLPLPIWQNIMLLFEVAVERPRMPIIFRAAVSMLVVTPVRIHLEVSIHMVFI